MHIAINVNEKPHRYTIKCKRCDAWPTFLVPATPHVCVDLTHGDIKNNFR